MPIKHTDFIIKGMQRDLSEHAFSPEFAYENHNIRITADKNDSSEHTGDMLALTNERGNKYTPVIGLEGEDMDGMPVGQCLINKQWVVFYTNRPERIEFSEEKLQGVIADGSSIELAAESESIDNLLKGSHDRIYRLWMNNDEMHGELLYEGNLGFDYTHPLETLGYYENEQIQKVYWTDGLNQPRFINIVETKEKRKKWNDKSFDFVATINLLDHKVEITERQSGGKFPAGVIQWHFTYSRQFGQETSIFESTKLYELKFPDRGAAPDEMTNQSFEIRLTGLDDNFDFVNIYSLIRTSLDSTPITKRVATLQISNRTATFVDTNLYGYAIDPQELLYKGGEEITAYTMENKDNTLFLGNYRLKRSYIPDSIKKSLREYATGADYYYSLYTRYKAEAEYYGRIGYAQRAQYETQLYLKYKSDYDELMSKPLVAGKYNKLKFDVKADLASHYRGGNIYRMGLQFQHITGKWSEAIWLGDYECNVNMSGKWIPTEVSEEYKYFYPYGSLDLNGNIASVVSALASLGYVKVRPLVIYPSINERAVLTQGVIANTLYMGTDKDKIYPDYFFRLLDRDNYSSGCDMNASGRFWYTKRCCVPLSGDYDIYRNEYCTYLKEADEKETNIPHYNNNYWSFYSPDVEFNDSMQILHYDETSLCLNGVVSSLIPLDYKNEVATSSISKPTEGHRKWLDDGRRLPFYWFVKNMEDDTTSLSYAVIPTELKVKEETENEGVTEYATYGTDTYIYEGRFDIYGWNLTKDPPWKIEGGVDFVKATNDSVESFWSNPKYPKRIPQNFNINFKRYIDHHYVGGFLWEDTFMNISTDHSDTLNKDVPTRAAGFMQYYGQWIYPVMLWQASGSINYDATDNPSSVLKSNKTLNYFKCGTNSIANSVDISNVEYKIANGFNTIKIENYKNGDSSNSALLYCNRMDNIILWKEYYSAIFFLHPIEGGGIKPEISFNWDTLYDRKYKYNNIFDADHTGTQLYNSYRIEDMTRSIPYDSRVESWHDNFAWHNLGRDASRDRSATIRYNTAPNYVLKINPNDLLSIINKNYIGNLESPIVSIKKKIPEVIFGGTSDTVLQSNNFLVAGESVAMVDSQGVAKESLTIEWTIGDTYFQDYEFLKTYPVSFEDENCVTEVLNVKLETYWNMDCRYDTWKGNPTFATSPANWNLMNPIYNQKDNFFVYHGLDLSTNNIDNFPNSFTWTLTKWSGDTTDKWTHITLASNMDVNGDKGEITKLIKIQDNLLCFQPKGLSQILYNEREQIATGSGMPIELANSGKVSGVRYLSEQTGCYNKWSICKNESGLYWVDDENKAIMTFGQQLTNLSDSLGFHSWINEKSKLEVWNPLDFNSFITYYDPYNESVMFFHKDKMLSYSTQLNCFDSFFSYGYVPYYMAFNGTAFTLSDKDSDGNGTYKVWEQHKGNYNYFFVKDACEYDEDGNLVSKGRYDKDGLPTSFGYEPYYTTLLVNPDMPYDKIFTNIDMRTDMWNNNGELLEETFSHLEVWNEFQWNKSTLIRNVDVPKVHLPAQHSILKKKFRVWYVDIPRDIKNPGSRFYKRDRMRNTWIYLKLSKELIDNDNMITYPYISDNKHIIHHVGVSYFV